MSRKDGASKRLAKTIEGVKLAKKLSSLAEASSGKASSHDFDADIDFDDDDNHAKLARAALQIDSGEWWTQPLREAFEAFNFDQRNPFHWRNLLIYFADAHFGEPRRAGKPQSWTDEKLCQLLIDFAQQKRATPDKNDSEICRSLKRDKDGKFADRYSGMAAKTIRRKLQDAPNPALNRALGQALDDLMAEWLPRVRAKVESGRWTQTHVKRIRDALLQILIHPERILTAAAGGPVRKRDRESLVGAALVAALIGRQLEREESA
jgi:hypothetical protein